MTGEGQAALVSSTLWYQVKGHKNHIPKHSAFTPPFHLLLIGFCLWPCLEQHYSALLPSAHKLLLL